ncbi:MAG: VCBS repeat-containing protein, partial [Gemmatimonadales bacterium]
AALYPNEGHWKFRDIAREAGVSVGDRPSTGAEFADVDGDGDPDLIVGAMGGRNALFLNDGRGHFRDATESSGFVAEARGTTTLALADVDGDGDLDLYVTNYKARTMLDSLSPQQRAFDQLVRNIDGRYEVIPALRDNYRVVLREDIRGVSVVQRADPDWFYLNDGTGHFTREALAGNPRFRDETGGLLGREPDDFGLAAKFFDANGDGAPDLYVANDFEDPDQFWINDGQGRFRLIARDAIRQTANSGMAIDVSDVDRDGRVDIFEADMLANDSHRRKTQIPTHTPLPKVPGDYHERSQWQRNVLLLARDDGSYAEAATLAGVEASGWSWSSMFLDVDLDGYEDLLIGNGHRWDLMDADVQERLKSTMTGLNWREERKFYPRLALRNVAFRNEGGLRFTDVSAAWHFGLEEDISHGMASGDLDGDGDQDVVINRLDAPALLLRNDAPAARILVRLAGRAPNTGGVGAEIRVIASGLPVQTREVAAGGLYLAGPDPGVSFAAPGDSVTVEVRWRDGARSVIPDARPGREYLVQEPASAAPAAPAATDVQPLFEDVSGWLGHRHEERAFDDFERQSLLPYALSRFGPGVSWIDLDADGDDDLVIGAGGGSRLGLFRNDGGRFSPIAPVPAADSFDFTTVLDGGAGMLLVGQSSYEASTPTAALAAPAVLGVRGGRTTTVAPGDTTSAGPLALADVDGDGDLDLFVGGRVAPGVYPVPATSRLFLRAGTGWTLDENTRALFRGMGLVSAAVFTDVDDDGDPDLALAMEWGPVRLLINEGGRFTDQTAAWGLGESSGRWNSITAGDFDGDGRMDLAAGNWGRNDLFQPAGGQPLFLYFGDWSGSGEVATSFANFDPRVGDVVPLASLSRLTASVPGQRTRTPTFAQYADASIETALGPALRRGGRVAAAVLDHSVFLNRGRRFERRSLPVLTQVAPVFGLAVADYDGDGREDLFLAQNFSPTAINYPRLDAGRGAVLLGDGAGGFTLLSPRASGVSLTADQRGAAVTDFDGDGRPDLAVGQNEAATVLLRNRLGEPGVRVRFTEPAVGVVVRVDYGDRLGPAREVHRGAGFWSQDGSAIVLGTSGAAAAVVARWPAGQTTRHPIGSDRVARVGRTEGAGSR